ncbi:MAG: hypothetical protein ABIJ17_02565 [Patescibacteria group bacterium]
MAKTLSVSILDNVSPIIKNMLAIYPHAINSGLKGVGWFFRDKVMSGIKSKSPGGSKYKEHSTIRRYRLIESVKKLGKDNSKVRIGGTTKTRGGKVRFSGDKYTLKSGKTRSYGRKRLKPNPPMMGRMKNATRYTVYFNRNNPGDSSVKIGWMDRKMKKSNLSLNQLGMLHEKGGIIGVTTKMRRLFFIAGVALKRNTITIPPRPTITPIFRKYKNQAVKIFEQKVTNKIIKENKRKLIGLIKKAII